MSAVIQSSKNSLNLVSEKGQSDSALPFRQVGNQSNPKGALQQRLESDTIRMRIEKIKNDWSQREKERRRLIGEAIRAQLLNLVSRRAA